MDYELNRILYLEDRIHDLKADKAALDNRIKEFQKELDSVKKDAVSFMLDNGVLKTETAHHIWGVRQAPPSVVITNLHEVPSKYLRVKVEPVKNDIKKAIQRGDIVEGAVLSDGDQVLYCKAK